jgi:hypothetical protein
MQNLADLRKAFIKAAKSRKAEVDTHVQGTPFAIVGNEIAKRSIVAIVADVGGSCSVEEMMPGYWHIELDESAYENS